MLKCFYLLLNIGKILYTLPQKSYQKYKVGCNPLGIWEKNTILLHIIYIIGTFRIFVLL